MSWTFAATIATTIGLPMAGVSAGLALLTYRSQIEANADAHMHSLFREYLQRGGERTQRAQMSTLKLYTLEEMIDWVHEQRGALRYWGWLRPLSVRQRREELNQWEATVASHLGEDAQSVLDRLNENATCYGERFKNFVRQVCEKKGSPQVEQPILRADAAAAT